MTIAIDLNCDCGESFGAWRMGDDAALLPHVSSANVACGAHAGDPQVMRQTVQLARTSGVAVGAHPGYPDLHGFGRRVIDMSPAEITDTILVQIGALYAIAKAEGAALQHVKPHGALYNVAARNYAIAEGIARAVAAFDRDLILVGLAGSELIRAGEAAGLRVAREAFADRRYEADGSLRDRRLTGAVLHENEDAIAQVIKIVQQGRVWTIDGHAVPLQADTLCLHGDTPGAAERAAALRRALEAAGVQISSLRELVG